MARVKNALANDSVDGMLPVLEERPTEGNHGRRASIGQTHRRAVRNFGSCAIVPRTCLFLPAALSLFPFS